MDYRTKITTLWIVFFKINKWKKRSSNRNFNLKSTQNHKKGTKLTKNCNLRTQIVQITQKNFRISKNGQNIGLIKKSAPNY